MPKCQSFARFLARLVFLTFGVASMVLALRDMPSQTASAWPARVIVEVLTSAVFLTAVFAEFLAYVNERSQFGYFRWKAVFSQFFFEGMTIRYLQYVRDNRPELERRAFQYVRNPQFRKELPDDAELIESSLKYGNAIVEISCYIAAREEEDSKNGNYWFAVGQRKRSVDNTLTVVAREARLRKKREHLMNRATLVSCEEFVRQLLEREKDDEAEEVVMRVERMMAEGRPLGVTANIREHLLRNDFDGAESVLKVARKKKERQSIITELRARVATKAKHEFADGLFREIDILEADLGSRSFEKTARQIKQKIGVSGGPTLVEQAEVAPEQNADEPEVDVVPRLQLLENGRSVLPTTYLWSDGGEIQYQPSFLDAFRSLSDAEQRQTIERMWFLAEQGPEYPSLKTLKASHQLKVPFTPMPCFISRAAIRIRFSWTKWNHLIKVHYVFLRKDAPYLWT